MKKPMYLLLAALMAAIVMPASVFAHTLWINVTNHSPVFYQKFGAATKTYFGYGHRYPVDDFPPADRVTDFVMITPEKTRVPLEFENKTGFLETNLRFRKPGQYIVAASLKPGFYTMYKQGEEVHHKLGPKTGLEGVILSHYYEQYTKSLINAGNAEGDTFLQPVGQRLEIIPLSNPSALKHGEVLKVKVLFEGEPAKFCDIYATHSGFSTADDFAFAGKSNAAGIATIRLTHWGVWLIKANMKLLPTREMQDKCNDRNYTATLTFETH